MGKVRIDDGVIKELKVLKGFLGVSSISDALDVLLTRTDLTGENLLDNTYDKQYNIFDRTAELNKQPQTKRDVLLEAYFDEEEV